MKADTDAFGEFEALAPSASPRTSKMHRAGAPSLPNNVSTEQAAVLFGIVNGVFTSVTQLLAGNRLSGYPGDTVPLSAMAPAFLVGAAGLVIGARLVPTGR